MKGRSHRLPTSAPPDDWVDESWTVDCVCGVNFDDGEEMVNCDECGVWVHTRCSRYVKGEASFACDKCKTKNSRNDSEETEVAQLLVELPTKTMRMEKSSPLNHPARRPFRLWSEMPMEEKVHVQGIPGGEPALFGGLSSVFSRELWNCTGYVPKKFNFQYKEFPCWEEKQEADDRLEEENDNPVNKGADVLFSLSKDTVLRMSGMRDQTGESGCDGKSSLKQRKKVEVKDLHNRHLQNGETKERRLLKPIIIHSSKRKKEDLGTSIDQNGKKKAKAVDKEYDSKKKGAQQMTIKTVFTPTNDAKPLEFYEARAPKFHRTETQNIMSGNLKDMAQELVCDGIVTADDNVVNPGDSLASKEYPSEGFSSDTSGHRILTGIGVKECKAGDQVHSSTESSLRIKDGVPVPSEKNVVGRPVNEEGVSMGIHNSNSNGRHSPSILTDIQKSEQSDEGLTNATSDFKGNHTFHNSNSDMSMSFAEAISKVKAENDFGNTGEVLPYNSSLSNDVILALDGINKLTQDPGISGDHMSENIEMVNVVASSRQSHDLKVHDVDRCPAAVSDQHIGKADELSGSPCQLKQELQSTESSIPVQREPSEPKYCSILTEEPLKSSGTILSPSITSSQRKVLSNVGKSCSPSSTVMISISSISDSLKHADSHNLNCVTKHSAMNNCTISMKKENTANDAVRDEDRLEILRRAVKERPKSSVEPTSKASNHNKISHTAVSKRTMADSKDSIMSSKTSAVNVDVNLAVGQPIGCEQTQRGLTVENKVLASCLPHRGEKFSQPSCPLSSKLNHVLAAFPPAPSKGPAGLSDEELALLLHQELNSSPRVPRVPRMRQTGSLPQSASSTATCMQFKRSSSLAGKDNIMVSRRRTKDVCRDGTRSSRDLDDAKKLDRKSSSPDQRKPDLLCTLDASSNRNMYDDSSNLVHSVTKIIPPSSTMATSGGVSYSMDAHNQSLSYMWNSPRNISDDDTGSTDAFSYQTLPGLLSEIMSKGKRMTYEELCNEVLPHWPNLRKHNGERYAYSSHSQAVLDCLRNRTEWAQLVDRGPKTNTNKKRRKVDVELEDECGKSVYAEAEGKSLETREFPKGKRKARKRRRLILQGRETKDVRKTRKACLLSDDDYALSSNSSEESVFSEDETQEGGTCRAESEASASSDEPGTTL